MQFVFNDTPFSITRYPESKNRSLQPWSAADELLLAHYEEHRKNPHQDGELQTGIYHDRFGFLATLLEHQNPQIVLTYASQEKALRQNYVANEKALSENRWVNPLTPFPDKTDITLIKIPKSMELFTMYLFHAYHNISESENGTVYAGFMTRHFTPRMLEVAGTFFDDVTQTKAQKKARLIVMRNKKDASQVPQSADELMQIIEWKPEDEAGTEAITLKQYYGVFSSDDIDPATRLLFSHLEIKEHEQQILDLGCGNGIIAAEILRRKPGAEVHAMDDDILAVESARLNLGEKAAIHHYDGLDMFPDQFFDLIVTNPPAHLGHENNIEISLGLFTQSAKKLKPGGRLIITSSRHLNYLSHLKKLFPENRILGSSEKFEVTESILAAK